LFPTNSLGLADSEWTTFQPKGQKRVMALGDSFTEGDGAPYDSSYVYLLNKKLDKFGDTVYMMNGGVCGSDPFGNYVLLRDRLLTYKPDLVLQVLATNDMITDIVIRGGMERFQKDGTQKFYSAPWWEPLYAVSYVSRLFFKVAGYNELLIKEPLSNNTEEKLNKMTVDLFQQYASMCRQHKIRIVVFLRPDKFELLNNKYSYDFSSIIGGLKEIPGVSVIDLMPAYSNYAEKQKANPLQYYWVKDGHHNATGYEMMAQTIFESVAPMLRDSIPSTGK
jgi:lysophospholipase L1-like esterase